MRQLSLLALAATGLLAAGLFADETKKSDDEKFSDKMFVEKAAVCGMFEVKSGQLAQRMATDAKVKTIAARMVADHTKANQELMTLARQKKWTVPTSMDQKHQEKLSELNKAQGTQFDKKYVEMKVKGHEKAVELFEKAAEHCQDEDLKAWAKKTLPTLKDHHEKVKAAHDH